MLRQHTPRPDQQRYDAEVFSNNSVHFLWLCFYLHSLMAWLTGCCIITLPVLTSRDMMPRCLPPMASIYHDRVFTCIAQWPDWQDAASTHSPSWPAEIYCRYFTHNRVNFLWIVFLPCIARWPDWQDAASVHSPSWPAVIWCWGVYFRLCPFFMIVFLPA